MCRTCSRPFETYGDCASWVYEEGRRVTDVLSGHGFASVCVTQRVVDGLVKHNIRGWSAKEIDTENIPVLLKLKLPKVFCLSVDGHFGMQDLEASGLGGSAFCPECGKFTNGYRDPERSVIDESSFDWDSSDFFHFEPFGRVCMFVTRRVVEAARKEKWTGAMFTRLDRKFPHGGTIVDHLSKDWPPSDWDEA